MFNHKIAPKLLIVFSFLSSAAYADTTSYKFSNSLYQKLNFNQQRVNYPTFESRSIIKTQVKTDKVKLGMVFTPEDLVIITNKNVHINYLQDRLVIAEDTNRIIGFYIKSFF